MAKITTSNGFAFDMRLIDVSDIGDILKTSSTLVRVGDDSSDYTDFGGNFTFSGDDVSGGTLTSVTTVANGKVDYTISGLNLDAADFYSAVVAGDTDKVLTLVLSGDDTIVGANLDDVLVGLGGKDKISGGAGNDVLAGVEGNDRLDGGKGDDTMFGVNGDDFYVVDSKKDVASEVLSADQLASGHDTVSSSISYTLGDGIEDLELSGSKDLKGVGNGLKNLITGNSGDNVLDGKAGADTLIGGKGDDEFHIDNAKDKVVEAGKQGTDTVFSTISHALEKNVENLTLDGSKGINGRGNGGDNVVTGNGGANDLRGLAGADTLLGGKGDDTLIGGAGKDFLKGGKGDDHFVFAKGEFGGTTSGKADVIQDFASGDKIDLSGAAKHFSFIGTDAFDKHGAEIRVVYDDDKTVIFGDSDGNGKVDFAIRLDGHIAPGSLTSHDFIF